MKYGKIAGHIVKSFPKNSKKFARISHRTSRINIYTLLKSWLNSWGNRAIVGYTIQ